MAARSEVEASMITAASPKAETERVSHLDLGRHHRPLAKEEAGAMVCLDPTDRTIAPLHLNAKAETASHTTLVIALIPSK
jgi:hypothetical protein